MSPKAQAPTSLPVCKSIPRYTLPKLPCPMSLPCQHRKGHRQGQDRVIPSYLWSALPAVQITQETLTQGDLPLAMYTPCTEAPSAGAANGSLPSQHQPQRQNTWLHLSFGSWCSLNIRRDVVFNEQKLLNGRSSKDEPLAEEEEDDDEDDRCPALVTDEDDYYSTNGDTDPDDDDNSSSSAGASDTSLFHPANTSLQPRLTDQP